MEAIIGLKKMQRKLDHLAKKGGRRVARASAAGMAGPLKTAIRAQVKAAPMESGMKKAARETISSSVKLRGGDYQLKVGFGVGKQSKRRAEKATARAGSKRSGVGISSQNIHWLVFGTGEQNIARARGVKTRATGKERITKAGAKRGGTPPYLTGAIEKAVIIGTPAAVSKAVFKAKIALRKEARKRR